MTWQPCLDCGEVAPGTRCDDCRTAQQQRRSERKGSAPAPSEEES